MPRKKTAAKKTAPKTQSKAAFVRSLPATTPAKDVVAKAKAAGISISENHVYGVRANAKKSKKKAKQTTTKNGGSKKNGSHVVGRTTTEDLLKAVASELGLTTAISILQVEHDRVHRLLGG